MRVPKLKFSQINWKKVAIGLGAAMVFLVLAYFFGLLALIVAALTYVWGLLAAALTYILGATGLTAVIATVTSWLTALATWFGTTWLGTLLMPIYNLLLPIVSKIAPFFTVGKGGSRLWAWFKNLRNRGEKELDSAAHAVGQAEANASNRQS